MTYQTCRFTGRKMTRSPLKLIGGKTKVRDYLYSLFPPHKVYIEPFLGSGTVLIGKPKAEIEIVSDINPYVINFFKELQSSNNAVLISDLRIAMGWLECDPKQTFARWKKNVTDSMMSDRDRAFFFYLITKTAMNGIWRLNKKGECNSSYCGTAKGRGILTEEWLEAVSERIKDVQFVHNDYYQSLVDVRDRRYYPRQDMFIFLIPLIMIAKPPTMALNGLTKTLKNYINACTN